MKTAIHYFNGHLLIFFFGFSVSDFYFKFEISKQLNHCVGIRKPFKNVVCNMMIISHFP